MNNPSCHYFTAHLIQDSEGRLSIRPGLGMLDADSPTWASDHFGVVVSLVFSKSESGN